MFLIRTAFWITIIVLLLPTDHSGEADSSEASLSANKVISAARGAISDLSGLCQRNPEICDTGKAALDTLERKARYSASLLADTINETSADQAINQQNALGGTDSTAFNAPALDNVQVPRAQVPRVGEPVIYRMPAVKANVPTASVPVSRNTLSKEDLGPVWQGPAG